MTTENYKKLASESHADTFEECITSYTCIICKLRGSKQNPIFTNADHYKCNICDRCVSTVVSHLKLNKDWHPKAFYFLQDIVPIVTKNL